MAVAATAWISFGPTAFVLYAEGKHDEARP